MFFVKNSLTELFSLGLTRTFNRIDTCIIFYDFFGDFNTLNRK